MLTEVTIKLTIKSLPILVLYNGSFKLLVGCSTKILHVLERNSSTNSIEVLLNVFLLIMEKKKKGGEKKKPSCAGVEKYCTSQEKRYRPGC